MRILLFDLQDLPHHASSPESSPLPLPLHRLQFASFSSSFSDQEKYWPQESREQMGRLWSPPAIKLLS